MTLPEAIVEAERSLSCKRRVKTWLRLVIETRDLGADMWARDIWARDIWARDIWARDVWARDIWAQTFGRESIWALCHMGARTFGREIRANALLINFSLVFLN